MQKRKISAIRGMSDIAPPESATWRHVETVAREVLLGYGYDEIRPPIVERTELFRRSVGEGTDIVEKEMYTFDDRGGDSLSLRPECTASCVRAAIEHGWLRGPGRRLWHIGPMFRYERPQKGRYRQFHQIDVEALGFGGPEADAELILVGARIWRRLGLPALSLELNSLGSRDAQAAYKLRLVEYFNDRRGLLDEDSVRRLGTNPLRILDSKNPDMQALIDAAPTMVEHLDGESEEHFLALQELLRATGVTFRLNHRLVRGLDYYTRTVFEWVTDRLGAQNAVCGGGRYDGLVEEIGGQPTPASGFAVGLERLVALLAAYEIETPPTEPHAYLAAIGEQAVPRAFGIAENLRDQLPDLRLQIDARDGSFKTKLKRADRSGAHVALIFGEAEVQAGNVAVKDLRGQADQVAVPIEALEETLRTRLW